MQRDILVSVIIHMLIIWALYGIHSMNILLPQTEEGMQLSLIAIDPPQPTIEHKVNIEVIMTPQEINLKKNKKNKQQIYKKDQQPHKHKNLKQEALKLIEQLQPIKEQKYPHQSSSVNNYPNLLINKILPYVILPSNLSNSAFAVIEVTLLPNMHVNKVKLVKSSGNSAYNANVIRAIQQVGVFPPLPSDVNWSDYKIMRLVFRPNIENINSV
jgi:TonB family protein